MKLEIYDAQGKTGGHACLPNSRRGISRVEMADAPEGRRTFRRPATAAFEAAQGPRVMPGTYTVKMTRGKETYSTTACGGNLIRRAKFTMEEPQTGIRRGHAPARLAWRDEF